MTDKPKADARSRYYDAVINLLDSGIKPELSSARSQYAYHYIRRELARLAALNDFVPTLPENLASLHPEAVATTQPRTETEWQAALRHEGRLLDEIEAATDARLVPRSSDIAETATALPEGLTTASLQHYLRQRLDLAITVKSLRILSGGRSKQTVLVTLNDGAGREYEQIIRRDLATSPTGATVTDEFELLQLLADAGVPVPQPRLCEADASLFNGAFILVDRVAGALDGHIFDPPSRDKVLAAARALGRLHALPAVEAAATLRASVNAAPDTARLRSLIESLREKWNTQARQPSVTIDYVFNWLLANSDGLQPLTALVHGDYSFHNLLFDGNELTAVLDWELARIGHPAEDLGYIRPAVRKRVDWDDFMASYREGGGPAIGTKEIVFYTLLERLRLITMLFKARDYVDSGMTDDIELVDCTLVSVPRMVHQTSVEIREFLRRAETTIRRGENNEQ